RRLRARDHRDALAEGVPVIRVRAECLGKQRLPQLRLQEAAGLRRVQLSLLRPCGAPGLQRHTPAEGVLAVAGSVELDEGLAAVVRGEVRIRLLRSTQRVCTREVRSFDLRELGHTL